MISDGKLALSLVWCNILRHLYQASLHLLAARTVSRSNDCFHILSISKSILVLLQSGNQTRQEQFHCFAVTIYLVHILPRLVTLFHNDPDQYYWPTTFDQFQVGTNSAVIGPTLSTSIDPYWSLLNHSNSLPLFQCQMLPASNLREAVTCHSKREAGNLQR